MVRLMAAKRKRPFVVAVQLDERERQELRRASNQAGVPLSVLVRMIALAAVRRGELVINDAAKAA
jgi:hypothetical protein